jgi:hypothetical protein
MRRKERPVRLYGLILSFACWGCYSYTPLGTVTPRRGADVVARLSVPIDVPLQDLTVHGVTVAAGKVQLAGADSLVLAVERFTSEAGTDYPGLGATVTLPRSHVAALEERRISTGRTVLVLGTGAAAIAAIVGSVGPLSGSAGGPPGGPPQQP